MANFDRSRTASEISDQDAQLIGISKSISAVSCSAAESESSDSAVSDVKEVKVVEKICVVCGDLATGTHFAAMTCEGCKGFFRRSMKKNVEFTCAFENQCVINKSNRKHCQACRLKKCLDMGMNSNLIMSDESVEKKRALIKQNRDRRAAIRLKKEREEMLQREKRLETSTKAAIVLTEQDKALIAMLLESHTKSYDFSYNGYDEFRGKEHVKKPDPEELPSVTHLAWFVAESSPDSPDPAIQKKGRKSKKESIGSLDSSLSTGESSRHSVRSANQQNVKYGGKSDNNGETFSSLHGQQQRQQYPDFIVPLFPSTSAPSTPMPKNPEPTESSVTSSPFLTPPNGSSLDAYPSEYGQYPPTATAGVSISTTDDLADMMENASMDMSEMTMTYLESLQDSLSMQDFFEAANRPTSLFYHFCDIMTWGIKKVIEFCKCIPEFKALETFDQINLLRGGCLEMLVLRSYFAFSSDGDTYKSDKFEYNPEQFKEAGASNEFIEQYLKVHSRMRKMKLKVEEICLLIGLVLFSPDRPAIQDCVRVEAMQKRIAQALRAYEYTHHGPEKACQIYSELLLLLPVLRTINALFSESILSSKKHNEMDPLILEVNN